MRLSDDDDYRIAVPAASAGNFDTARKGFERLISKARALADKHSLEYLLQSLGDMEARAGNLERALSLHAEAIRLDATSPLPVLAYAQGLAWSFANPDEALLQLLNCEALLESYHAASEDELPVEWYEKEIDALRKEIAPR